MANSYQATSEPTSPLSKVETFSHRGFRVPDPFAPRSRPGANFVNAILATTLFRCWHMLIFFGAWATLISILNEQGHGIFFQPTLLTVMGTVIGFIISYRTTSSFERYNEGRRLWSSIIVASRMLSRTIWFHVPDHAPNPGQTVDDAKAHSIIEKKSAIDLIEAFAVAVKHYLRGEDGIYYKDLYYLVKYLPAYALPAGMPSMTDLHADELPSTPETPNFQIEDTEETPEKYGMTSGPKSPGKPSITIAAQTSGVRQRDNNAPGSQLLPPPVTVKTRGRRISIISSLASPKSGISHFKDKERLVLPRQEEQFLLPASMPPRYGLFDLFPFSLLVKYLTKHGKDVKGKKAARVRAKLRDQAISHNLPLEISLYLSSYVSSLQRRKILDVPTTNILLGNITQLIDSLTGLERVLTTPIPFSYSIHLWTVTVLYCLALPPQVWPFLKWVTIPATIVSSFVFFGFLVAGEEIENPFGYDKNDLNLDHFTHNIIRNELRAVTSTPPPDPARWAFAPENNLLFSNQTDDRVTPEEWLDRGPVAMLRNLRDA